MMKVAVLEASGLENWHNKEISCLSCSISIRDKSYSFRTNKIEANGNASWMESSCFEDDIETLKKIHIELHDETEKLGMTDLKIHETNTDSWYSLTPNENIKMHIVIEITPKDKTDGKSEMKEKVKTRQDRNKDKAELLQLNYDDIYARSKATAEEIYREILERNAAILLGNEKLITADEETAE